MSNEDDNIKATTGLVSGVVRTEENAAFGAWDDCSNAITTGLGDTCECYKRVGRSIFVRCMEGKRVKCPYFEKKNQMKRRVSDGAVQR